MADLLAEARHGRAKAAMATGLLIGFAVGIVAAIGLAASFSGLCGVAAATSPLSLL